MIFRHSAENHSIFTFSHPIKHCQNSPLAKGNFLKLLVNLMKIDKRYFLIKIKYLIKIHREPLIHRHHHFRNIQINEHCDHVDSINLIKFGLNLFK